MTLPSSSTIPSIALDTSIFPGMAKGDIPQRQIVAMGQIAEGVHSNRCTVWATTNALDELNQYQNPQGRQEQIAIYDQWLEVPGYGSTRKLPEGFSTDANRVFT